MSQRGVSLPELLVVLVVLGASVALAVPPFQRMLRTVSFQTATQEVTQAFQRAQILAITSGRNVAVRWQQAGDEVVYSIHQDGNGNGVTTADIKKGIDRKLTGPVSLRAIHPGVQVSFLPSWVDPDPAGKPITNLQPVHFNSSSLSSFAPSGGATPGSIYLSDANAQQSVVRVSPLGHISALKWDASKKKWVPA